MLRLSGIEKSYRLGPARVEVLKGIDLAVSAGEFLVIMGSSGCGKTTLMNLIGLLDRPTAGSYAFDEREVPFADDLALSRMRNRKIGFVFQQYHLLPGMTAAENVGLPLVYRNLPAAEVRERSRKLLGKVGLAKSAHLRPGELSGGERQRVAIARALAGDPALVLADEPTGALDEGAEQEILDLFGELNGEAVTIVMITHSQLVAKRSSRRLVLRDGVLRG